MRSKTWGGHALLWSQESDSWLYSPGWVTHCALFWVLAFSFFFFNRKTEIRGAHMVVLRTNEITIQGA